MARIDQAISNEDVTIFDEEMAFLSSIQTRFLNMHSRIPVAHDDPDVKHLTEAMAAFMAKGRLAGRQQIDQLHQRVFHQLLPYLSTPVVSMGLIQADTRYLSEATDIKAGSVFTLSSDDEEQAHYRNTCDMPLAPIGIERVGFKSISRMDSQALIRIKAHTRAPGKLSHLPLFLNVNDNFTLSLWLKQLLQEQLIKVSAVFDEATSIEGRFGLGACQGEMKSDQTQSTLVQASKQIYGLHPVEKIRYFFQLPQQENYLNLYFSDTPQQWSTCDLILTFKGLWPRQLKIASEFFQLGVISVENVIQEQAEPIVYNATQSNCPIRPPSTTPGLSFLKCLGVYQGALKDRDTLRPGILKGGSGAYDLHLQNGISSNEPYAQLDIQLPDAFKKPVKITVDALWHQPEFSKHLWKKLKVCTHHLDIRGLSWNIFNPPVSCIPFSNSDPQSLLELSLLKNKRELNLDDIIFILESIGSAFRKEFASIKPLLKSVYIAPQFQTNKNKMQENYSRRQAHYVFSLHEVSPSSLPLLNAFFSKIEELLNAWIADVAISVGIQTDKALIEQLSSSNDSQHAFTEHLDTPIYSIGNSEVEESDYRLIPQVPDLLFFIEGEGRQVRLSQREAGHE